MNETCDRHPSARAAARVLLPSLGELYFCNHCLNAFEQAYEGKEFYIAYAPVEV